MIGVLLGETSKKGVVQITNSFARKAHSFLPTMPMTGSCLLPHLTMQMPRWQPGYLALLLFRAMLNVAQCYCHKQRFDLAVPFEEDEKDQKVWYVDHQYLEKMFVMFRKVNGKLYASVLST